MKYYKNVADGYLISLEKRETVTTGAEITETEYNHINSLLADRPTAPDGFSYRLSANLEWELYEFPTVDDVDEDISEAEALDIILGGAV